MSFKPNYQPRQTFGSTSSKSITKKVGLGALVKFRKEQKELFANLLKHPSSSGAVEPKTCCHVGGPVLP